MSRAAKTSAPPASETRAAAVLPPWVQLISAGAVEDIEESLRALRARLAELLWYAADSTREKPETDAETLVQRILESGSAALLNANFIEEAICRTSSPEHLPAKHWRDERVGVGAR